MNETLPSTRRRQLLDDGFCNFLGVLDADLLGRLRTTVARLLAERAAERAGQVTTGSMIATNADPIFAELIAYPPALAALASLGYPQPTFTDGYMISKPPRGPRLFKELATAAAGGEDPALSDREDEIDVCVRAGDLLVGDARLLHAAHHNQTSEGRMLITLWYQPDYNNLPEDIQAQMVAKAQSIPGTWPRAARELIEPLRPRYAGKAAPAVRSLRPH